MKRAAPTAKGPPDDRTTDRVAEGRPEGVSAPTYAEVAQKLLDQGYEPVPIIPRSKRVAANTWTKLKIDEAQVNAWRRVFGACGVGLRAGHLVAIDIDILDPDRAHAATEIAIARLGPTIMRVGRWPKRLLLYRTDEPFKKLKVGKIEVLGLGQQFVAFGIHPETRRPYDWPTGDSPLDVALNDLPLINEATVQALLVELLPVAGPAPSGSRQPGKTDAQDLTRGTDGKVIDGRDGWLSTIAFHAVHDAFEQGEPLVEQALTDLVWRRFEDRTDLSRPKQDGRHHYEPRDALKKVRDKLNLLRADRLPLRQKAQVEPVELPPVSPVDEARQQLEDVLEASAQAIEDWHRQGAEAPAPRIGVRATTGLGKSTAARRHVAALVGRLAAGGLPQRVLNLVPSLALADETAAAWRAFGLDAVVLRGYEAVSAVTREPMCLDLPAVRAAADAGIDIQSSVCFRSRTVRCPHHHHCPKQANRRAVTEAEVVVAAYDVMFTGFASDVQDLALILIDEACWQRSFSSEEELTIEALPLLGITGVAGSRRQDAKGAGVADVVAARGRLSAIFASLPTGEVRASDLTAAGIDPAFCRDARDSEYAILPASHLSPGQGSTDRKEALTNSLRRALGLQIIALWSGLIDLLGGDETAVAKIWLGEMRGREGQRPIRIYARKTMEADLTRLPLLHLDATLRPELTSVVLPELEVTTVGADVPHQEVRLISGSFGKAKLCPDPRAPAGEIRRRSNRLQECVDYVRWQAQRHASGRVLVITYKAIEADFAGIPGVEVAHYNAIAGLDGWGDVAALIMIGRPLPRSGDVAEMTGALFNRSVQGGYAHSQSGITLRNGPNTSIRTIRHSDPSAEVLRAAICDDEMMQALGRSRGVNRTAENPLEVHVLADVALPIAHDRVQPWELVCPDIVQQMLLAGLAVNSAADATKLHPRLFATYAAADHAFRVAGFNRHFPISNLYREMAVKSAAYRVGGKGHGWHNAWWIGGTALEARRQLEAAIGSISEWIET
jgi:hypothetical protein